MDRKAGHRIGQRVRGMRAVHADACRDIGPTADAFGLDQNTRELRTIQQQVVRPLELQLRSQRRRDCVGRGEAIVSNERDAGTFRVGMKLHQNNDFAAAAAATTSGAGQAMNSIISSPLTPSTTFKAPGIGSNVPTGSSKYITLTIE